MLTIESKRLYVSMMISDEAQKWYSGEGGCDQSRLVDQVLERRTGKHSLTGDVRRAGGGSGSVDLRGS